MTVPAHASATRAFWVFVLALFLALAWAAPAAAHAVLLETTPGTDQVVDAPPERVVLGFNEPVEIAFGAVRVFDTHAERVDDGEATHASGSGDQIQVPLRQDLGDGTYTVTWRAISADSHPVQGAFVFHVGAPGAKPEGIAGTLLAGEGGAGELAGFLYGWRAGAISRRSFSWSARWSSRSPCGAGLLPRSRTVPLA